MSIFLLPDMNMYEKSKIPSQLFKHTKEKPTLLITAAHTHTHNSTYLCMI